MARVPKIVLRKQEARRNLVNVKTLMLSQLMYVLIYVVFRVVGMNKISHQHKFLKRNMYKCCILGTGGPVS